MTTTSVISVKFVWLCGILTILLVCMLIVSNQVPPVYDQSFIDYTFTKGYPVFEQGITSLLVSGCINWLFEFEPASASLNTVVRCVAAFLYTGSGLLLAWGLLSRYKLPLGFPVFIGLLASSGFIFLWLSTELFVGAYCMLTLWGMLTKKHYILTTLFLILFTCSKPDALLPGILLGVWYATHERLRKSFVQRGAAFIVGLAVFALPGMYQKGSDFFKNHRTYISFSQHYASLVQPHQISTAPEPWQNSFYYTKAVFGDERSVIKLAIKNPKAYMDFLFLSVAQSLRNSLATGLFVLLVLSSSGLYRIRTSEYALPFLLLGANLLPIVLVSYFHIRYQARFYPLFLITSLLTFQQAKLRWKWVIGIGLAFLFVAQIIMHFNVLAYGYWFPD